MNVGPVGAVDVRLSAGARWVAVNRPGRGLVVHARGCAWLGDRLLQDQALAELVAERADARPDARRPAFLDVCGQMNGSWAVVACWRDGEALAAVDRLRTMPLFYGHRGGQLVIADSVQSLADCDDAHNLDDEAATELLLSGYVMDSRTIAKGISQIQPGEVLYSQEASLSLHRYYRYLRREGDAASSEVLTRKLDETMDDVFARLVRQFAGRRVMVPLSGGLDSRLILAMMKRHGHVDLTAFSYGRPGSRETETSRAVADAVGVDWVFIPYDDGAWFPLVSAPRMREFWRLAGQGASAPHLQDYLALHMFRRRDPSRDAVFFPGYSGDMIAGAWTLCPELFPHLGRAQPQNAANHRPADIQGLIRLLVTLKYDMWPAADHDRRQIMRRMESFFAGVALTESHDSAAAFDLFEFENRQARYLVNGVRSFEFFQYGWWLPLCDSRLMDFFLTVPTELRKVKRLYAWWMRSQVFVGPMARLAEIPPIGDGWYAWYGEPPVDRRTAVWRRVRTASAIYRRVEPRRLRTWRIERALRAFAPPDLRFHEWFAANDAAARSMTLASFVESTGFSIKELPEVLTSRFESLLEYPLCFVSPLALLNAAYLGEALQRGSP